METKTAGPSSRRRALGLFVASIGVVSLVGMGIEPHSGSPFGVSPVSPESSHGTIAPQAYKGPHVRKKRTVRRGVHHGKKGSVDRGLAAIQADAADAADSGA